MILRLAQDAVTPIVRGHPWAFRQGLRGHAEPGTLVQLDDPRGRPVAWGLADEGPIAVRVLSFEAPDLQRLVVERIQRADVLRTRVVPGQTDAYRVVNGAGDGLPGVVLDRYGEVAILRLYSCAWEPHLDLIIDAVRKLGWATSIGRRLGVKRVDGAEGLVLLHGPEIEDALHVREHGITLLARPHTGQKTGLFLDQRENRRRVAELAAGRRVLNLFGYNGGFSIHAALAGAAQVTTVDLSQPALDDAAEIFRLNGLDPAAHAFVKADIFEWKAPGRFDLVICDPPNLTHGKSSDGAARSAYRRLNQHVSRWVSRDGLLATSSCTARLRFERWEDAVREGLSKTGAWSVLERAGAPADHPVAMGHPEGHYLKFAVYRRLSARS